MSRFDYFGSFGMGLLCYILGLLLVLITFKETKKEGEAKGGRNMVSLSDLANSFMVLVKKREGGMRHIVILLIVAFTVRLVYFLCSIFGGVSYSAPSATG